MKLIVGLGNPGRKYEQTRHNVGFTVAAKVGQRVGATDVKSRFSGEVAEGSVGEKLVILCPQTYMNASGKSVRKACDFYKLSPEDILVVCDDLDLPVGRIRLRAAGSAGGQKGIADIIRHLGTDQIPRLKIGIDRPPPGWDAAGYVLGKFTEEQQNEIDASTSRAADAAIDWIRLGIHEAMNRYNTRPEKKQAEKKQRGAKQTAKQPSNISDSASTACGIPTRGDSRTGSNPEPHSNFRDSTSDQK